MLTLSTDHLIFDYAESAGTVLLWYNFHKFVCDLNNIVCRLGVFAVLYTLSAAAILLNKIEVNWEIQQHYQILWPQNATAALITWVVILDIFHCIVSYYFLKTLTATHCFQNRGLWGKHRNVKLAGYSILDIGHSNVQCPIWNIRLTSHSWKRYTYLMMVLKLQTPMHHDYQNHSGSQQFGNTPSGRLPFLLSLPR